MIDPQDLPRPAPDIVEAGVPAVTEIDEERLLTGDSVEGEIPPLDHAQGAEDWGVTAAEQQGAEPLAVRLAREEPEHEELASTCGAGSRLWEPGADGLDDEAEVTGELLGGLEDTESAEEAAVRVVDEPPGLTYDDDPGYVDNGPEGGRP